jgi:hypothetical protein
MNVEFTAVTAVTQMTISRAELHPSHALTRKRDRAAALAIAGGEVCPRARSVIRDHLIRATVYYKLLVLAAAYPDHKSSADPPLCNLNSDMSDPA